MRMTRVLIVLGLLCGGGAAGPARADERVPGQILAELVPGTDAAAYGAEWDCTIVDSIPMWNMFVYQAEDGANIDLIVARMLADPRTVEAEPHERHEMPEGVQRTVGQLDVTATSQTYISQTAAQLIKTSSAHGIASGSGVTVAMLDSGVSLGHPVLRAHLRVTSGADVASGGGFPTVQRNGLDDDDDGLVDEGAEHGTLVAGAIHLAAPAARILPVRVLSEEGYGTDFALAKGILYALQQGADVINFSLGMRTSSAIVGRAVYRAHDAGVVMIGAAGNRGERALDYPADYSKVVGVAAVDDARHATAWTNYDGDVDLSAPGLQVLSTYGEGQFGRWDGTSFATPLVAGAAALLLERYPGLSPDDVEDALVASTQPDANPQWLSGLMGSGVIDLDRLARTRLSDRTSLRLERPAAGPRASWTEVAGATGYDLVRGNVTGLAAINATLVTLGALTCVADDSTATAVTAAEDPPPGEAFFYVFRDNAPPVIGYGRDSAGRLRRPASGDCSAPGL